MNPKSVKDSYLKKYGEWSLQQQLDPLKGSTLLDFAKYLSESHKRQYVRNAFHAVKQKYFPQEELQCPRRRRLSKPPRLGQSFTADQLEKIKRWSMQTYEHDELALLVGLLLETDLRPKHCFQSNPLPPPTDETNEEKKKLLEFAATIHTPVFPKRHHTYLNQFKDRIQELFPTENLNATFEMLKRSLKRV